MFAICDAKVVVRIGALIHTIWGSGSADGHHGGWAFGALGIANFVDGHHLQRDEACGGWRWRSGCYKEEVDGEDDKKMRRGGWFYIPDS